MNRDEKAALAYLTEALELSDRIDHDMERSYLLRTLMTNAPYTTSSALTVPRAKEIAGELAEVEARIIEDIDALIDHKTQIANRIGQLPDVRLQLVLELRYLCRRSWEQVAADLELGLEQVKRLHKMALRAYCYAPVAGGSRAV